MFNVLVNGEVRAIAFSERDANIIARDFERQLEWLTLIGKCATVKVAHV